VCCPKILSGILGSLIGLQWMRVETGPVRCSNLRNHLHCITCQKSIIFRIIVVLFWTTFMLSSLTH